MPLSTSHVFHRPFQPDIGPQDSKTSLIWPRRFEPWLCELRDRIGGCPERFELCGADVTEVAVTAFDVVEVVDVIGDGPRQLKGRRPFAGVGQLDLQPAPERLHGGVVVTLTG